MRRTERRVAARTMLLACSSALIFASSAAAAEDATAAPPVVSEVVVTASRQDLLGVATTASQGSVTQQELSLRPVYRVGQLLESTPSLVVTAHSGEGKANQYLLRGFNLDHGTDFASFVDAMPVNRPTNAHGQGYSDVNFEIPELAQGLDYTKGPYYAAAGDFGAVASTHLKLANEVPNQVAVAAGSFGIYNLFAGGARHIGNDDRIVGGLLQWRDLGKYPIRDGDEFPQDKGYSEINLDVGYKFSAHLKAQLTVFNLTDTKANAAAYFYAARLPGEPPEGIDDFQVHPLEPISAVAKVTYAF